MADIEQIPQSAGLRWIKRASATVLVLGLVTGSVGAAVLYTLNSGWGRSELARQLSALDGVKVSAIEGSLFSRFQMSGIELTDADGVWLAVPRLDIRWSPSALLQRTLQVDAVTIRNVDVYRTPRAEPGISAGKPAQPLTLPRLTEQVISMKIGQLALEALRWRPDTPEQQTARFTANAALDRGKSVQLTAQLQPRSLGLEDEIKANILLQTDQPLADITLVLRAEQNGLIAGLLNLSSALEARLEGSGKPDAWTMTAQTRLAGETVLDIKARRATDTGTASGFVNLSSLIATAALGSPLKLEARFAPGQGDAFEISGDFSNAVLRNSFSGVLDLNWDAPRAQDFRIRSNVDADIGPAGLRQLATDITLDATLNEARLSAALNAAVVTVGDISVVRPALNGTARATADGFDAELSGVIGAVSGLTGLDPEVLEDISVAAAAQKASADAPIRTSANVQNTVASIAITNVARKASGALSGDVAIASDDLSPLPGALDAAATADLEFDVTANGETYVKLKSTLTPRPKTPHWIAMIAGRALNIQGKAAITDAGLFITDLAAKSPQLNARAAASLSGERVTAMLKGDIGPLTDMLPSGAVFDISAAGAIDTIMPTGTVRVAELNAANTLVQNLQLRLDDQAGATALTLQGRSEQGPLDAHALITRTSGSGLAIRDLDAALANLRATGAFDIPAGAALSGGLDMEILPVANSETGFLGLSGDAQIKLRTEQDGAQRIRIDGGGPTLIYGPIDAPTLELHDVSLTSAVDLSGDAVTLTADADVRAVTAGGLVIDQITLKAQAQGDEQRAQLGIYQKTEQPTAALFNIVAAPNQAGMTIQLKPSGTLAGQTLSSSSPLSLSTTQNGFMAAPAELFIGAGTIDLNRLEKREGLAADIAIENIAVRALTDLLGQPSYAGTLSGQLSVLSRAEKKRFEADLQLSRFAAEPGRGDSIDLNVTAAVDANVLAVRMAGGTKSEPSAVSASADVPIAWPSAQDLFTVSKFAPLSGGAQLQTRLAPWWALADIADQSVTGILNAAASLSGTLAKPEFSGRAVLRDAEYENLEYGMVLKQLNAAAEFTPKLLTLKTLTAKDGRGGSMSANAVLDLVARIPKQSQITLRDFQLLSQQDLSARADAQLSLTGRQDQLGLSGDITIAEARYAIAANGAAAVPTLTTEDINTDALPMEAQRQATSSSPASMLPPILLDVKVSAPRRIFVTGLGLSSEWQTKLDVSGSGDSPDIRGQIGLVRGELDFAGKRFSLERGKIYFDGGAQTPPRLDMLAENTQGEFTARIGITGTPENPTITLTSSPSLPQDEILSRILFGTSATDLSPLEAVQLASAISALSGGGGGALDIAGQARAATGLDRLSLGSNESATAITGGKYLSEDVYLQLTTDPSNGQYLAGLEWYVTRTLSLLSQYGAETGSNVAARWSRSY